MNDDDLAARVRKAESEYYEARTKVKESEAYHWWKSRTSSTRFVIGAAVAIVVVVSLVRLLA
jgi:hypothetical protein